MNVHCWSLCCTLIGAGEDPDNKNVSGYGGDGLSGITDIGYDFKDNFGVISGVRKVVASGWV